MMDWKIHWDVPMKKKIKAKNLSTEGLASFGAIT